MLDAETRRTYESANVDSQGNFSIQVLSIALEKSHGLTLEDTRRPENHNYMLRPEQCTAFVLNRSAHWYCMRKLDGSWYICNSMAPAPERMLGNDMSRTLKELQRDSWTIFMVKGTLPTPMKKESGAGDPKNWVDPANPPADPNYEKAFGNAAAKREREPTHIAFAGEGNRLGGSKAPSAARPANVDGLSEDEQLALALSLSSELAAQAAPAGAGAALVLDEAAPTTSLQVRLADGSRKVVKANHTHTLRQLKGHVATLCPGVAFDLKGGFPPKPLTDDDATLADAKLLNESIVVSAK